MQRATRLYRAHTSTEAARAMAEARRCLLRILEMTPTGSEAQAYTQQALAALQPEHVCSDTAQDGYHSPPLPATAEPPPPNPHYTAAHLLSLQMDMLAAREATGAGVHIPSVVEDLLQAFRMLKEGTRSFFGRKKARHWGSVHRGEEAAERAEELLHQLLQAGRSPAPARALLRLPGQGGGPGGHQTKRPPTSTGWPRWNCRRPQSRDTRRTWWHTQVESRATWTHRHTQNVLDFLSGPLGKLRHLAPFLHGQLHLLAHEALADLVQWSTQFWGTPVSLLDEDSEGTTVLKHLPYLNYVRDLEKDDLDYPDHQLHRDKA